MLRLFRHGRNDIGKFPDAVLVRKFHGVFLHQFSQRGLQLLDGKAAERQIAVLAVSGMAQRKAKNGGRYFRVLSEQFKEIAVLNQKQGLRLRAFLNVFKNRRNIIVRRLLIGAVRRFH